MSFKDSLLALHLVEQKQHDDYQASQAGKFAVRVRNQMKKLCENEGWAISFTVTPIDYRTAYLLFEDGTELQAVQKYDKVCFQARAYCPDCGTPGWSNGHESLSRIGAELVRGELSRCLYCERFPTDDTAAERLVNALAEALSDAFDLR